MYDAVLGVVGLYLKATGRLPAPPPRNPVLNPHEGDPFFYPYGYVCSPLNCDACCIGCQVNDCAACSACCECGGCDGSLFAACGSEGAALLLPVLAVVLFVFAVIGVVVGVFFATVVVQRVVHRHVHLLSMRSECQRVVVVDLASEGMEMGRQQGLLPV